jgi:hypothetical protein
VNTKELNKKYGLSRKETDIIDLGKWKLNEIIDFKDNKKRKLIHIQYINMCVDVLTFDDGLRLVSEEIINNFKFKGSDSP